MRPIPLALASCILLAGCIGGAGEPLVREAARDPSDTSTAAAGANATWTLEGGTTIGWIAGAGTHSFAGDAIVGVRSESHCPRSSFIVPPDASGALVSVGAGTGAGPYYLAVSGPDFVSYSQMPLPQAYGFEQDNPPAGVWQVEVKPMGGVVNQQLSVHVTLSGEGSAPTRALEFVHDPDCLL